MLTVGPARSIQSSLLKKILIVISCCCFLAVAASAQNYSTVVSFDGTDGADPYYETLALGTDGNLYGTTHGGGANSLGTVFQLTLSGTLTVLHSFAGQPGDGAAPACGLVLGHDGNFYGTTTAGGSHDKGTVFKITPSGTLTTIYNFAGSDGMTPSAALVQGSDGSFYGTTTNGGSSGAGSVFKITSSGTLTTLHSFTGSGGDGSLPNAPLVQGTDHNFYGTTTRGGTGGLGSVFKMTSSGTLSTLHSFSASSDGFAPYAGLVQATDGNFYGTAEAGGANGAGTLYKITSGGSFTNLHDFDGNIGGNPIAPVTQATDGKLYGTTHHPPSVFQITTQGTLNTLYNGFQLEDGPDGGLLQVNGVFYGTTQSGGSNFAGSVYSLTTGQYFVPVRPCRLVDTRGPDGPFGGPPIQGGTARSFNLPQSPNCNIPASAAAYSLNVTVVPHGALGYLTIWPTGENQPLVSTLNSPDGRVKANAAIVPAGLGGPVSVFVSDTTDVILDIDGYFAASVSQPLQFYPLVPCRVVDTRQGSQQPQGLGPPFLHTMETRDLPILSSPCLQNLPQQPTAYSFNATVVPNPLGQPLGYLTLWPSDQQQPVVSTLNNPTATVVANAAIVPAAVNGNVKAFVYDSTDLVIDINGYFAPVGQNGYSFYRVTPCRVLDTRVVGHHPFQGVLNPPVDVVHSQCQPSGTARAFVLNATVVPVSGPMGYLTLWPDGQQQPTVSTLNAYDGFTTSNMAIVPSTNGIIDAYADGLTNLILDISGYFGP